MSSREFGDFLRVPLAEKLTISYDKDTADKVFNMSVDPNPFMDGRMARFKQLGLPWEDKLVHDFDKLNRPIYFDEKNTYKLNSLGYRSGEFDGSADILYAGCSNTFGMGVPEEAIWGSVVAKSLGSSYANISKQGASTQWIVKNVFSYISTHGNPKAIYCLFPDIYRLLLATDKRVMSSGGGGPLDPKSNANSVIDAQIYGGGVYELVPEYSRLPHDAQDVVPINFSIFLYVQSVLSLALYCKSNNIQFIWSTWNATTSDMFVDLKNRYPAEYDGFVELDSKQWNTSRGPNQLWDIFESKDCHSDLEALYGLNFHRGMDDVHGVEHAHTGIHRHAHWAETFLREIDRRKSEVE